MGKVCVNLNIEEIISRAVEEAIKTFENKKRDNAKKKALHNTELLLKNYNSLMDHYNNSIDNLSEISKKDMPISIIEMNEDEMYIMSIRRSKFRTFIMISHINAAMEELKEKMEQRCQLEKFMVIEQHYLKDKTFEQVAEDLNCSVITARRWKNEMINQLSILLFGIDGLKLEV